MADELGERLRQKMSTSMYVSSSYETICSPVVSLSARRPTLDITQHERRARQASIPSSPAPALGYRHIVTQAGRGVSITFRNGFTLMLLSDATCITLHFEIKPWDPEK
jgi:hypothetical protein